MSVLLQGVAGAGTSALAAHVASISDFPYIQMLSPASLVGLDDFQVQRPPERDPPHPTPTSTLLHTPLSLHRSRSFSPSTSRPDGVWSMTVCLQGPPHSHHHSITYTARWPRTLACFYCLAVCMCDVVAGQRVQEEGGATCARRQLSASTHTITRKRSWNESLA